MTGPVPTDPVDPPGTRTTPPVDVRPARATRLVFEVPADESIELSTAGLLGALGRLEMVRLIVSPSNLAGWAHATDPVRAADAAGHVELWHTRLGVRGKAPDGTLRVDERSVRPGTARHRR